MVCRLNRSPSTISREIQRNRAKSGYFAKYAHQLAKDVTAPILKNPS
ncbi:helix-turn-helix domain-containing protein [Acinetobacter sp.]